MDKSEIVRRLSICRAGKCGKCPYSKWNKHCTDDLIDDIYEFLSEYADGKIRCPYCDSANYYERYSTATAIYSPVEYIDGMLSRKDDNYYTTECVCAECDKSFSYTLHNGEVKVNT